MSEIDWIATLKEWRPSSQATEVTDAARIDQIILFCEYVSQNCFGSIVFFGDAIAAKQHLERDNLSKNAAFELGAKQLKVHRRVWFVVQRQFRDRLSYEFPMAVLIDDKLRYLKFQIQEGVQGLTSPSNVKKIWLRYHKSDQEEIKVLYVQI